MNWFKIVLGFTVLTLFLPAGARADLVTDIEDAFEWALSELDGNELDLTTHFDFAGKQVDVELIGFAFCRPDDVWADPSPTPLPGVTAYGCQNLSTVDTIVAPTLTTATVQVSIDNVFLDLATSRDRLLVPCAEFGSGTVTGDAYLITGGSLTVGLELTEAGNCYNAEIVPGSVEVIIAMDEMGCTDVCLDNALDVAGPALLDMLNPAFSLALEAQLITLNDAINSYGDGLGCKVSTSDASWGTVKGLFPPQR